MSSTFLTISPANTGIVDYDPKHRVPPKKEYAIKRRKSREIVPKIISSLDFLPDDLKTTAQMIIDHFQNENHLYQNGPRILSYNKLNTIYSFVSLLASEPHPQCIELYKLGQQIETSLCKTTTPPWTAIVRVDKNLTSEYRTILKAKNLTVLTPAWGPHITWARKEIPMFKNLWSVHQGKTVDFLINSEMKRTNHGYWFVDVESTTITNYRKELGLNPKPAVKLHLTIGKEVPQ